MCDFNSFMTQEIHEAFTETISAREGKVTETFHQPGLLFVRSVLPQQEEIRARDNVQGGVALRATDTGSTVTLSSPHDHFFNVETGADHVRMHGMANPPFTMGDPAK